MKQVVIATKNKGKAHDFEAIFKPLGYNVLTLFDVAPSIDIEETGTTFEENAILKAEALAKDLQQLVIADDSGLEVDALNGEPGVYSARYAGDHDDEANIDKVLEKLSETPDKDRTARFVCCLAITGPEMDTMTVKGYCEGQILRERQGEDGFGYDPIFYMPELDKTLAQVSAEEKGKVSHRGNALRLLTEKLAGKL